MRLPGLFFAIAVVLGASSSGAATSWRSGRRAADCTMHGCTMPTAAIITGVSSASYLVAWGAQRGELPTGIHVGGALLGGLSIVTSMLYIANDDPRVVARTFGAVATMAVGVPALVLGLHGLITADVARDADKPLPPPNWYGPVSIVDAHGKASPAFAFGGTF
jgi:hypothetical protein